MTRKHFIALAEALYRSQPEWQAGRGEPTADEVAQWNADVNSVADVLGQFNERFDRRTFVQAARARERKRRAYRLVQ